jgi:hypothetical protein
MQIVVPPTARLPPLGAGKVRGLHGVVVICNLVVTVFVGATLNSARRVASLRGTSSLDMVASDAAASEDNLPSPSTGRTKKSPTTTSMQRRSLKDVDDAFNTSDSSAFPGIRVKV